MSVAVTRSSGEIVAAECDPGSQSEQLVPAIRDALRSASAGWTDIDRIAVTLGPGTFTGVRVGIAAARGLSLATGIETAGAGTLEVMAHQVAAGQQVIQPLGKHCIAVCVDARREHAYLQLFDEKGAAIAPPCLWDGRAAPVPSRGVSSSWIVAGSAAALFAHWASERGDTVSLVAATLAPTAAALAAMAHRLGTGPIRPLYLRAPDAKPQTGKTLMLTDMDVST